MNRTLLLLAAASAAALLQKGPDRKWTDEEATARWKKDAPDAIAEKLKPILRTDHYVILTNSAGSELFGRKMEEAYAKIRAVYEFDEPADAKLLVVFLFRSKEEYVGFCEKMGNKEMGNASKGHAWKDYYATWYEAPNDPVHIHEGTHQLFSNRMRLGGGGSWFQEGVAEYMSTLPPDRKVFGKLAAEKGRYVKLRDFVVIPSLLMSAQGQSTKTGESQSGSNYLQAATIIEFVRESEFGKPKFKEFLRAVGGVRRSDSKAIDEALKKVYGVDLDGFEKEWLAYWRKK